MGTESENMLENELQRYLETTVQIREQLRKELSGKRITADALSNALKKYYPGLEDKECSELCAALERGLHEGEVSADRVFSQPPENILPSALEELLANMDEPDQRRFLKLTIHDLYYAAEIELSSEMCINLDRMETQALKQDLVAVVREQGDILTKRLFDEQRLSETIDAIVDDQQFSPEENELIEAAVQCVAHKIKEPESVGMLGRIFGSICCWWRRNRDRVLDEVLPTLFGYFSLYGGLKFVFRILYPILEKLSVTSIGSFLAAGLNAWAIILTIFIICCAFGFSWAFLREFIDARAQEIREKKEKAIEDVKLHSAYLQNRAKELAEHISNLPGNIFEGENETSQFLKENPFQERSQTILEI